MTRQAVWLGWQLSSRSGWGILGLNVFFQWAARADITPLMAFPIDKETLSLIDPLRLSVASKAIEASNDFVDAIAKTPGERIAFEGTVIELVAPYDLPTRVCGKRNIGRCIFENA